MKMLGLGFCLYAALAGERKLIEQAYDLYLQKQRSQALQLLTPLVKKKNKQAVSSFEDIAKGFLTDEAHQQYERALTQKRLDPQSALASLNKALAVEPDQVLVLCERARLQIVLGACSAAQKEVLPWLKTYEDLAEASLLRAQLAKCAQDEFPTKFDVKGPLAVHWRILEAQRWLHLREHKRAQEILELNRRQAPDFPETHYWMMKLAGTDRILLEASAQNYLKTCRQLSSQKERAYSEEPFLCRRSQEVEAELKKLASP